MKKYIDLTIFSSLVTHSKFCFLAHINQEGADTSTIERSIRNLENEEIKLNVLIYKEQGMTENLEQSNVLQEGDFMASLKVTTSVAVIINR